MFDRTTAETELKKKLDPANVKPPAPGKYGDYIEGVTAIYEANRIFGHFGWEYTLDGLQLTNATKDSSEKHHVGYMARVTVTVDGVSRGDVGHGQGHGKSEGDAHDSAVKEAVTDALKRALRTFGNPFGLALYDKTKANVGKPEPSPQEKYDWFKQVIESKTTRVAIDAFWNEKKFRAHFDDMSPEHQAKLQAVYDTRCAELDEPTADELMGAG